MPTRDLSKLDEVLSPKLTTNGRELKDGYVALHQNIFKMMEEQFDEVTAVENHMIAEGNWVARRYRLKFIYYPGGRTGQNPVGVPVEVKGMGFYEFDENGLMIQNYHIENTGEKLAKIDAEYADLED
jgi:hypothetical protein